mmetsp:Transcript_25404/g.71061  ORF Transcript_25404/g.71061 Transcript_25404/m.71061 type:complete len:213 (-) Transcript_25404:1042-1680(-)
MKGRPCHMAIELLLLSDCTRLPPPARTDPCRGTCQKPSKPPLSDAQKQSHSAALSSEPLMCNYAHFTKACQQLDTVSSFLVHAHTRPLVVVALQKQLVDEVDGPFAGQLVQHLKLCPFNVELGHDVIIGMHVGCQPRVEVHDPDRGLHLPHCPFGKIDGLVASASNCHHLFLARRKGVDPARVRPQSGWDKLQVVFPFIRLPMIHVWLEGID